MEKSRRWATPHLIGVLGFVAVATSIAAEFSRTKKDEVRYDYGGGCTLPQSPALALGITAAISLFLAQLTANIMGGCVCCSKRNPDIISTPISISITFLSLSWTSFVLAMFLLIAGSMLNQRQYQWLDSECYVVKPGVFGGGALLSCATTAFAIIYYSGVRKNVDLPIHSSDSVVLVGRPAFEAGSDISSSSSFSALPVASVGIEPEPARKQESSRAFVGHEQLRI